MGEIVSVHEFVSEYFLGVTVHHKFKRLRTLKQITVCMILKSSPKCSLSILLYSFLLYLLGMKKKAAA